VKAWLFAALTVAVAATITPAVRAGAVQVLPDSWPRDPGARRLRPASACSLSDARTCAILSSLSAQSVTLRPAISEARGLTDFDLDGNGVWRVAGDRVVLEKAGVPPAVGAPGGVIRRPAALAVLRSAPLSSLTLTLEIKSTAPAGLDVRDILLIVGYQSPDRFYYVHVSRRIDAVHNGIFVVDRADRRRLDVPGTRAPLTDQEWHHVRLERDVGTGRLAVFFDSETEPLLSVMDRTLLSGRVGFGSFDETGEFRNLVVTGWP
jgi:hypothetical protein